MAPLGLAGSGSLSQTRFNQTAPDPTAASSSRDVQGKLVLACRPMVDGDIGSAILLLSAGFPEREPRYWRVALERMRDRFVPDDLPRYGIVLTANGRLAGIVLTISSVSNTGERRINLSSWYTEEAYRGYSNLLIGPLLKLRDVTLFNISPAPSTLATIGVQGFERFVGGTFQALAALAPPARGSSIRKIEADTPGATELLRDHASWGCLCYEILHGQERLPFVFAPTRFLGGRLPGVQLAYCEDIQTFVRFAGPLGRALARAGRWAVLIDSDGPVRGLLGVYRGGRGVRFFSGESCPRLGDLSYTEMTMFGA